MENNQPELSNHLHKLPTSNENEQVTLEKPDILIVDDTPDNIRFLSTLLVEQGYKVRKATTGKMALTAIKTVMPDLVLLDINMPMMNGYEVCKYLKEDEQTRLVPVIFLSALDEAMDKVKAFQVGGVDYITKPFQIEEVLARIQNQLTISQLQTQLKAQNAQLQQALSNLKKTQNQLIQREKIVSLGQLMGGIAHEINNPLCFISSNLSFARDYLQELLYILNLYQQEYPHPTLPIQEATQKIDLDFLVSDLQQLMGSMRTGVERIGTILLALRIFSRLNESEIKAVDIHEGLDSTLLLLEHRLKQDENSPIQVIKNYGKLPLVTCYASEINQVFLNLLNNAIDALEESVDNGKITDIRTIWIQTEFAPGEKVKIRIQDNGVGISEQVKLRLFDPFFTTKPVGKGSGLGLSTSYQIVVEKHKGLLTCDSSLGKGAEFVVEIPANIPKV